MLKQLKQGVYDGSNFKINDNLFVVDMTNSTIPEKKQGVGYARKIGMDLALPLLKCKAEAVISCLDADTLIANDYFIKIYPALNDKHNNIAGICRFKTPVITKRSKQNYGNNQL